MSKSATAVKEDGPVFIEPQFIDGYRPGERFSADAGLFINGGKTTKQIVEQLTAQGYSLRPARQNEIVETDGRIIRTGIESPKGPADLPRSARRLSSVGAAGTV